MQNPRVWGARPEELAADYPCDGLLAGPVEEWFRAVTVRADPDTVFRWLCQLKVAPYSYDGLDNFGRRSPRELTPGADSLECGQRVMTIFELTCFEPGRHLTMVMETPWARRLFGDYALSYTVSGDAAGHTRLVVKMRVRHGTGLIGSIRDRTMPWGDLLMMSRQLHTLRELAEQAVRQ
ncbi:hypothetical protein ACFC1R_33780 [Kitasatospora sp. NPDC056138]|uniref:hypothetical protein n=1 Tax=Kitasatospora sp. NPDC056138 TaxID=3345724 RepID=UPI0035DCF8D8